MRLTWKDGAATLIVAVIGTMAWAYFTDQGWPGVSGPRVVAVLAFFLGVIAYTTGARSLNRKLEDLSLPHRLVRFHSLGTLIPTLWVVVFGSDLALAILVGIIGVVWLGVTLVHVFTKAPAS